MKYCKDCTHWRPTDMCARPRAPQTCPVRGVVTPTCETDCYYERESRRFLDCGNNAVYFQAREVDYTAMASHELIHACGDDAQKWAKAFMQAQAKHGPFDEGTVLGWFANAIEHSGDVRRWKKEAQHR